MRTSFSGVSRLWENIQLGSDPSLDGDDSGRLADNEPDQHRSDVLGFCCRVWRRKRRAEEPGTGTNGNVPPHACALRSRITATLTCLRVSAPPPPTELAPVLCVSAPPPRGTWTRALASLPPPPASGRREGRPAAPSGAFDLTTSDFPGSSAQAFTLQVFLKGKKKGQKVAALVSECCTKENNRETGIS